MYGQTRATDQQIWIAVDRACAHEKKPLGATRFKVKSNSHCESLVAFNFLWTGMTLAVQWGAHDHTGQRPLRTALIRGTTRRQWYFFIVKGQWFLPIGGQWFCPLVAIRVAH